MKKQKWIAIMLLVFSGLFAKDAVNFSGTWLLDESKIEDAGNGPRMSANKIVITHEDNNLSLERFMSNPMMGDFGGLIDTNFLNTSLIRRKILI